MKRIYQDKFGIKGNCFEASLASILEIPLEKVPYLSEMEGFWFTNISLWLKEKFNLGLLPAKIPTVYPRGSMLDIFFQMGVYYIACGKSVRNIDHACVADSGKILHDPHPEGNGIAEIEDCYFLVRL